MKWQYRYEQIRCGESSYRRVIEHELNRLGESGWEVVDIEWFYQGIQRSSATVLLKRQVEE